MIKPVWWQNRTLHMLDQLALPTDKNILTSQEPEWVAQSIEKMIVRGAPAIGITAAYGLALAAIHMPAHENRIAYMQMWAKRFARTRPTAVNLFWAIDRMLACVNSHTSESQGDFASKIESEALAIHHEDILACKTMGAFGEKLLPKRANILTHCNAGALATGAWGTALGIVRSAVAAGKSIHVYSDETRPYLQGSRLTMWELMEDGIDCTMITDNMAGYLMSKGDISAVIVGADRIAVNGDVANKIGTYSVAVLANYHAIPMYVAAPLSTIDMQTSSGRDIPIEERSIKEVTSMKDQRLAPKLAKARHPAFDVTPHHLISAIVTEKGILQAPYTQSIAQLFDISAKAS